MGTFSTLPTSSIYVQMNEYLPGMLFLNMDGCGREGLPPLPQGSRGPRWDGLTKPRGTPGRGGHGTRVDSQGSLGLSLAPQFCLPPPSQLHFNR